MTLNYLVAIGIWLVVLIVGIVVTLPDVPVVPLMLATVAIAVLVPVLFYPFSSTLWAAVDLAMHPLDAAAVADAEAHVGAEREGA